MSLRESSKRKRNDEVDENEAPSKALVPRSVASKLFRVARTAFCHLMPLPSGVGVGTDNLGGPGGGITTATGATTAGTGVATIPLQRRSKQYVAVRRGLPGVRKCIFKSWEEAAEYLEGHACDVEYRICENIEEAAAYAFQEELDEQNDENELLSVSSVQDFSDDLMLMIFSFVCGSETHSGGGTFADTSHLHELFLGFGATSKLCRKRCIE